ncbi:MAG: hypothetical protein ACXWD8_10765 [Mycobacterium sp.]
MEQTRRICAGLRIRFIDLGVWSGHVAMAVWITGLRRSPVSWGVSRGGELAGQRTRRTLLVVCRITAPPETTTMHTDVHSGPREERRAQLERRRVVVAQQLRRLAVELADLDRQLDEIEQSEG